MKTLEKLNYYELLEIAPHASPLEVHQAYKEMYDLYHDDSLASYSFFPPEERREILAMLDEAYSTLMNVKTRAGYDRSLVENGTLKTDVKDRPDMNRTVDAKSPADQSALSIRDNVKSVVSSHPGIQEILARETISGAELKSIRDELGIPLEEVAKTTKVRMLYLEAIENDEFEKIPAGIFLKGFLKAYGQCMGLDADTVASRYLKRMKD
ncbi:MAG: helix-turn-helix domain-containing protein [Deltaproteobacteria bacterium]|nr:helix-turn-helix domain-containing protein [Deltaproteobacteria bacterium]